MGIASKQFRGLVGIFPKATEFSLTELPNFTDRKEVGNELTFSKSARSRVDRCEEAPVTVDVIA